MNIGIDLGTANTLITAGDKIIVNEPTVVAYNTKKKEVLAVGEEAYRMIGRTPDHIKTILPLEDGVISDYDMTMLMVKELVGRVCKNHMVKPQIIICVPSAVTDVESRAVIEAALSAGARKVYLIKEPFAALLGAGVDISKAEGAMVVDIGGGTADIAVVSFNGIALEKSVKSAGNVFNRAIVKYASSRDRLLIGEKTAEAAKFEVGCVFNPNPAVKTVIKGRNLLTGLPQATELSEVDACEALTPPVMEVVAAIKSTLEVTPPEMAGDILSSGIVMTGGGSMLRGFAELVSAHTGAPCRLADNPLECVSRGIAMAFGLSDELMDGFEKISMYKSL